MKAPAYPAYKPSGVEWLGDVPEHWEVRRLKFAATCNDETLSEDTDPETEIVYVDISSVNLDAGITSSEFLTFEKAPSRARRKVRDGDTIVSTVRTYLKAIAPVNKPPDNLIVSTGFAVIRPLDIMEPSFLGYFLQSQGFIDSVVANSKGVSYPAINSSDLVCIPVSYPKDRSEQQAIAEYLDRKTGKIDELIEKKKELIKKLAEHRTALITAAVTGKLPEARGQMSEVGDPKSEDGGQRSEVSMKDSGIAWIGMIPEHWEVRKLKFEVSKVGSGVTPSGGASSYRSDGIPFLRSQNIHFDGLRLDDVAYIDEDVHESMCNSKVLAGDVLLNITGASIGRCNFYDGSLGEANVNQHVCIIRPESGLLTRYLHYFVWSEIGQLQIRLEQSGSGREGLNFAVLKNFFLPITDKDEQQRIIEYLDNKTGKIDGLIKKTETAIKTLEEYRTALITAAVTGKVDVATKTLHYETAASSLLLAAEKKRGYGNEDTGEIGRAVLSKSPR